MTTNKIATIKKMLITLYTYTLNNVLFDFTDVDYLLYSYKMFPN